MSGVYVDIRVLEATRRLVAAQPTRKIPVDNRLLVELATHPEALRLIACELGDDWQRFGMEYEGALAATTTVANLHALPFEKDFDGLQFPEDEVRIGSRLGAADRVAVFDPAPAGPFGLRVTQLSIRHHLLPRGLPADAQAQGVEPLEDGRGFTFSLGAARFRYGRLGVERVEQEPKESHDHAA